MFVDIMVAMLVRIEVVIMTSLESYPISHCSSQDFLLLTIHHELPIRYSLLMLSTDVLIWLLKLNSIPFGQVLFGILFFIVHFLVCYVLFFFLLNIFKYFMATDRKMQIT